MHDSIKRDVFTAIGVSQVFGPVEGQQIAAQATRLGATGTATVQIQGTNMPDIPESWTTVATLNPATTGAAATAQSAVAVASYLFWRFNCTALAAGQTLHVAVGKQ